MYKTRNRDSLIISTILNIPITMIMLRTVIVTNKHMTEITIMTTQNVIVIHMVQHLSKLRVSTGSETVLFSLQVSRFAPVPVQSFF